jgi:hypothetical protein
MSVYEKFSKAFEGTTKNFEQRQKEEAERRNRTYTFDRDEIQWLGLEQKKGNITGDYERVFRIVGLPWDYRESCYDPKVIFYSEFLKEDKKGFAQFIWKQQTETLPNGFVRELGKIDEDWILFRAYKTITARTWDNNLVSNESVKPGEEPKKGGWVYHYADSEAYRRILPENNVRPGSKEFPKSVYPSQRILLPIIDRHDNWCYENKHLKLLSSGVTIVDGKDGKPPIVFAQKGAAFALYNKIIDNVVRWHKHWDLDIIAYKNDKDYVVYDITDNKISEKSKQIGRSEPLTEEEMNFAKYDLDKNFAVSRYSKIKKELGRWFSLIDGVTGSKFTVELEELVKIEEQEDKNRKANESRTVHSVGEFKPTPVSTVPIDSNRFQQTLNRATNQTSSESPASFTSSPSSIPTPSESIPERRQRPQQVDSTQSNLLELCKQNFKAWDRIPAHTQEIILKELELFKGVIPIWKKGKDKYLCTDVQCKFSDGVTETELPENVDYCPCCGVKF